VQLELRYRTWGGKRAGAGRRRVAPRPQVPHRTRPKLATRYPVHVTVRIRDGLPRLRTFGAARVLRRTFLGACRKEGFRICQFSVQGNHIHLLCEARDADALARGMQGFKVSCARRLNGHWQRRGALFSDRYHAVILRTPRQVRAALVYVLQNARHHHEALPRWAGGADPFSSAWHFDGWRDARWRDDARRRGVPPPPSGPPPVAAAKGWLLTTAWRRAGLLAIEEAPRRVARRASR
jgi:REP element-mobilizing transposase RayT